MAFELQQHGIEHLPASVMVYDIAGPMFFGAAENFERALLQTHTDPKALIVRLRRVPFMDITGIQTLQEVSGKLRQRGVRVLLCEANERVLGKLRKARVLPPDASDLYADRFGDALCRALADAAREGPPAEGLAGIAERFIETSRAYLKQERRP